MMSSRIGRIAGIPVDLAGAFRGPYDNGQRSTTFATLADHE
jgi:hypothetical protein